jgi:acetyl/propionyl-CoA carboxylase alpha subunit
MKYIATVDDQAYEIEINSEREVEVNGQRLTVDFQSVAGEPVYSLLVQGRSHEAYVHEVDDGLIVQLAGRMYHVRVEDDRQRRLREASGGREVPGGDYQLKSPMPGLVVAVPVESGQTVERGDILVILESMKMQNELKAPRAGSVTQLRVKSGDRVDQNQVMLTLS